MKYIFVVICLLVLAVYGGCGRESKVDGSHVRLTNVSYDTTREFYERYNQLFHDTYMAKTGYDVNISQSHGGSSGQARSVMEGNNADVVTLGSEQDINLLAKVHLIQDDWIDAFPNHSAPYTSTIVMLVRKGNPLGIQDWNDLIKTDVHVIAPDPKSSSGACWIFLAAWYYGSQYYGDDTGAKEFVHKLYRNVTILDSGARSSTTTFVENGQGDVLLLWENEAFHLLNQYPDTYEMITPSVSIQAEPSVAVVTGVTDRNGTTTFAKDYISFLYDEQSQRLLADYGFRPSNKRVMADYTDRFNTQMKLTTIRNFGGWPAVYERFFKDGGVFDEIYGT
ncbi:sulfate ABC transporter substrate-binding protein [Veillonella rodentium]|uniref:Sulfate starvation-induced protein 2 n=1 Tax=Veillonella rodentium TaxID=248315 RepID=A0A239YGY4_9FIRM|nr:sulfate ABC transporter substrate-binding protein [Veillonella rodentium]SNV57980.1 Sulfate starvation-induced protein 2 [Veillonella rodentium]